MKTIFKISIFWAFGLLLSCNSGVEVERISADKLVTVNAFISPKDSIIRVYVFKGGALGDVLNVEKAVIKNATVSIANDLGGKGLFFDEKSNSYIISNQLFRVMPTKKHFLKVKTAEGIELNAECVVPASPDEPVIEGNKDNNDFGFSLAWPSEQTRYYTVLFDLINVDFTPRLGASSGPSLGFVASANLFDNKDRSPKPVEWKIRNAFLANKISLQTVFTSLDENAYKYLKTRETAYSWNRNSGNFFPNLQEPQPVFSNIRGGVGVFGAYNSVEKIVVIK